MIQLLDQDCCAVFEIRDHASLRDAVRLARCAIDLQVDVDERIVDSHLIDHDVRLSLPTSPYGAKEIMRSLHKLSIFFGSRRINNNVCVLHAGVL